MTEIDARQALAAIAEEQRLSLAGLSAAIGRNPAYLQQYVRRGSPRRLGERERRLLADYLGVSEAALGGPAVPPPSLRVPRLDIAASAGPGAFIDDEVPVGADAIDPGLAQRLGIKAGRSAIIRVRGTSMEPGLVDGDLILVDRDRRTPGRRGEVFVIRADGVVMVKRVARGADAPVVTSDNPAAAPVSAGTVEVIGKVVWLMRAPR